MNELQAEIVTAIRSCVTTSPLNRLRNIDGSPIFEEPLVGFANGDDNLFELYKSVVAPEYMAPRQVLAVPTTAHVGVVSWILPVAAETRRSNLASADGPSLRWNHTRFQGEEFNEALRRHIVSWLAQRGLHAVAPILSTGYRTLRSAMGHASTWSERHTAYAAGLGTFGLSDGLITARGIAHRCGSVVVAVEWPASPRPYADRHAYCTHFRDSTCGACIDRCPAGAIGLEGHDKDRCREYVDRVLSEWHQQQGYIGQYLACGLCQVGVPCESGIPA